MDREKQFAAATGFGLAVPKMILENQVFLLRLWADSIEKFAHLYEGGAETLRSRVEQEAHRADAA
jgi:hypothetical protein